MSTTASDIRRVAATVDATHNVAQQALEAASHATKSAGQSELCACELFDTLQEELCVKFDEDRTADETRRGQEETRIVALRSSIESLQKRMNEMNVPDINVLANLEQNLQRATTESSVDENVGLDQLSKRLDE